MTLRLAPPNTEDGIAQRKALVEQVASDADTLNYRVLYEVQFHPYEQYRLDLAIPDLHVGLEVEGGNPYGYSSHTGARWFSDMHKYNQAAALGWTIIRTGWINFNAEYLSGLLSTACRQRKEMGFNRSRFTPYYPLTYVVYKDGHGTLLGHADARVNNLNWLNTRGVVKKDSAIFRERMSEGYDFGFFAEGLWRAGGNIITSWYAHPLMPDSQHIAEVWVSRTIPDENPYLRGYAPPTRHKRKRLK